MTKNCYVFRRSSGGICDDIWVDVTRYEKASLTIPERLRSPLFLLGQLEKDQAAKKCVRQCFSYPVIEKWIGAKRDGSSGYLFICSR